MVEKFEVDSPAEVIKKQGYSDKAVEVLASKAHKLVPAPTYLEQDNVIYIAVVPDDSASIAGENKLGKDNTQDVIGGHNAIIDALQASKEKDRILFKTQYLNSDYILNDWVPLYEAKRLSTDNFKPEGGTPLYDKTILLLGSVVLERARAKKRGQDARWGILVVSDGDDTVSSRKAEEVKIILDNMRERGELLVNCEPDNRHAGSIAFMGIDDGTTDFEKIARSMGIYWILRADRLNPREMRRAFNTFSEQLISAMR
jgi:hypothetical protein